MSLPLEVKIVDESFNQEWNQFVNDSKWGDILQFDQWATTKSREGWKSIKIGVFQTQRDNTKTLILATQILYKKASKLGNYAYAPHGPVFQSIDGLKMALPEFNKFIYKIAPEYQFFCLEIEPKIGFLPSGEMLTGSQDTAETDNLSHFYDPQILEIFRQNSFQVTGRNMQPKHKLYYDLTQNEQKLLSLCQKSTRYNIKLAIKKGVQITEYTPNSPEIKDKLVEFYNLLLETQKRAKGYPIRPLNSFLKLFEVFKDTKNLSLFEASFEGQVIAMNISQRTHSWSSSFYAASNRLFPEVKAMYLLRWESILAAQRFGSQSYDFWGIIPNSGNHSGYSDHKLSFGGQRLETYGLLALPLNKFKFMLWNRGITLRTKSKDWFRKKIWKLIKK